MSIRVKLHPAELFLNWFPKNTQLYIRGERGADAEKTSKLYEDLFHQLAPFLEKIIAEELKLGIEAQPRAVYHCPVCSSDFTFFVEENAAVLPDYIECVKCKVVACKKKGEE